jgi:hypothetical protein
LSPYIGNPKLGKFAERYTEEDGPFSQALVTKAALQEFRDNADKPTLDLVFKYARIKSVPK